MKCSVIKSTDVGTDMLEPDSILQILKYAKVIFKTRPAVQKIVKAFALCQI